MKKQCLPWVSAVALAVTVSSPLPAPGLTNGVIVITTRTASDALWRQISSSTLYDADDYRGPGVFSPGDAAMAQLLQDNGYTIRLVPEWLLRWDCHDPHGYYTSLNPQFFYRGSAGQTYNPPFQSNYLFSASLVIVSGSGSASDMPPPNTNGIPILMGEHSCIGDRALAGNSSLYLYAGGTTSSNIREPGGGQYMKVVAPDHPIMQGIPLEALNRVKLFRDPYPEENAHVPSGGKTNYQYSWTAINATGAAPGTVVIGLLASDTSKAVFAVNDAGGRLSNGATSHPRYVHFFVNEDGSTGPRRAFNALTDIGRVIFLRACKWAMGETLTPYQPLGVVEASAVPPTFTNSLGMKLVQIPPGTFTMGYWQTDPLPSVVTNVAEWVPPLGDFDERPAHAVTLSRLFGIGLYEVSNAEYEQYDPSHRALRGKLGYSTNDNEAVVFVSWHEAKAFCDWLSAREGRPYRLPTEAEWEYACRAGTTTHFSTGDTLPGSYLKGPAFSWYPDPDPTRTNAADIVPVTVGQTPPNPWGLYDLHGNVEEWCADWYGPYQAGAQTDPVGRADGIARVTRGGSHSTVAFYLRSENRVGALPEDKSWYIGFRVVAGEAPTTAPLPEVGPQPYQTNISQTTPPDILNGPDTNVAYFAGPRRYVNIPGSSFGPLFSGHNHDAGGIVQCPNGDLLAMWYTCVKERGRELALAASRLRYGQTTWESASAFFDLPDRNDHAPCLWHDGDRTIYHLGGVSAAATWGNLAVLMRTSTNNGVTWSKARLIIPEHNVRHQPIACFSRTSGGLMILPCDAGSTGNGGTVVWLSGDAGASWYDPGAGRPKPTFAEGNTGAWIAGIHGQVAELSDGRLMALARGDTIGGKMPKSISADAGTNWTYSASVFPPIGGGQRGSLLRLREGPLFFAGFASSLVVTTASGGTRIVSGLYAALSYDNGVTWPYVRLVSDDGAGRTVETTDGETFTMSLSNAEPKGYLTSTQARNGVIHLISSRQHYEFNLKWLATRPPP